MIGQVDIRISARRPNMPLNPVFSFKGSPSSIRLMDVPQKIGTWDINRVYIKTLNPDNETSIVDCVRIGSVWVGTFLGCDVVGKVKQGIEVLADGIDEKGEGVTGYVLGIADYIVMDKVQNIDALIEKYNVRFLDELPPTASKGDLVIHNGSVQIFDGVKWVKCSDSEAIEDINERLDNLDADVEALNEDVGDVKDEIEDVRGSIPTKTSELENDSNYVKNYDSELHLSRGEESGSAGYVLLEPGMLQMDSDTNVTLGLYGQQANKIEMNGGSGGEKGITLYTDESGYGYIKLNGKDVKLDIDEKIEKPETFSKGQVLTVVEVEDAPTSRNASLQSVSPRASTHLEWQAVDPDVTMAEVDDKINQFAAHYLTKKDADGKFVQFATHADLARAKQALIDDPTTPQFWYGDDAHVPDKNDYLVVLKDEDHANKTTRYSYVGDWPDGFFRYQYTINDTALSQEQWDVLNGTSNAYAKSEDIPTKTSDLTNDSGFITSDDLPDVSDVVRKVEDTSGNKTAVTIGTRAEGSVGIFSFTQGESNKASQYNSTAIGKLAHAEHGSSFVWNGSGNAYRSHGWDTFNVGSVNGADGFYIGDKNLTTIISEAVQSSIGQVLTTEEF